MRNLAITMMALLAGCGPDGMSTAEVRLAAMDEARERFSLPADAPLEATVWTGNEYDGEPSVCGTVSGAGGQMPPQRFMARLDPFEWLLFEGAHSSMLSAEQNKFPSWSEHCTNVAGEVALPTSENQTCGTRIDANQDGAIQEAEYQSFGFAFDNWDVDNDYSVSPEEFGRCWPVLDLPVQPANAFQLFDEDGDQSLSQEEFFAANRFERFARLAG